jgi:hypothetical protein
MKAYRQWFDMKVVNDHEGWVLLAGTRK